MGKLKENKIEKSLEKITTQSKKKIKKGIHRISNPTLFQKKKVGLVLGGGAAKGFAHIGVLKVLEKNNINIDMVAGTSIGALVGASYLVKKNIDDVEKIARAFELKKFLDFHIPKRGIIKGEKLENFLRETFSNKKFEDLNKKLFVTATDLNNNQLVIFNRGDLSKAVRASISIPGIFEPVENDGRILIDGGWKAPVPTQVLKDAGCDVIIAVNLNSIEMNKPVYDNATLKKKKVKFPNILQILLESTEIYEKELISLKDEIQDVDVLIEPRVFTRDSYDFNHSKKLIRKGELATEKQIKKIKRVIRRSLI